MTSSFDQIDSNSNAHPLAYVRLFLESFVEIGQVVSPNGSGNTHTHTHTEEQNPKSRALTTNPESEAFYTLSFPVVISSNKLFKNIVTILHVT